MEDIGEYANTLGFEEESHLELFQAVMNLDKKYRVPILFRAKARLKDYLKEE
ncbi:hypothetical protein [Sporofaciens sp. SGI.106]|uniref:hypothetical protein n=1 Tax=Sporofaciens sp. SGI.106 TaxID=3420568 RepID=UPI003D0094F1